MELTIEIAPALYGVAALIVIRLNSTTLPFQETTVAAPRTSLLRASVNTVQSRAGHVVAVKVGNATPPKELRLSSNKAGGVPSKAREPLTGPVAHHDSGVL